MLARCRQWWGRDIREPDACYHEEDSTLYDIAVHEACHFVTYALYEKTPDSLCIHIRRNKDLDEAGGVVDAYFNLVPQTTQFLTCRMLTALAGQCGERFFLNAQGVGAEQDLIQWEYWAKKYFTVSHNVYWFANPGNAHECRVNAQNLCELRNAQNKWLKCFLRDNKTSVMMVVDRVLKAQGNSISGEEAILLLDDVKQNLRKKTQQ